MVSQLNAENAGRVAMIDSGEIKYFNKSLIFIFMAIGAVILRVVGI